MRLIDEAFTECPFYGARQMVRHLGRQGHAVGRNRVCPG
jgi:putative transposase